VLSNGQKDILMRTAAGKLTNTINQIRSMADVLDICRMGIG
jgi:hypothetical protein